MLRHWPHCLRSKNSCNTEGRLFFLPFRQETTPSFHQVVLVDPIFLPRIISSDTDSKYLSGFPYPLFAIINPSNGEAFPKLAMTRLDGCCVRQFIVVGTVRVQYIHVFNPLLPLPQSQQTAGLQSASLPPWFKTALTRTRQGSWSSLSLRAVTLVCNLPCWRKKKPNSNRE